MEALSPLLVPESEARRMLGGLCTKTLRNLRHRGELPAVHIGTRVMYDVADLKAFIEARKTARGQQ